MKIHSNKDSVNRPISGRIGLRGSATLAFLLVMMMTLSLQAETDQFSFDIPIDKPNPQAVKEVAAGKCQTASAAWWGFDADDSTAALQAAINSKADTIIVPNMGRPWPVKPLTLRSHLKLILEEGVELLAKKDEFHGRNDSLLNLKDATHVTIQGLGKGAALRMRREDYANPQKYRKSAYRMGVEMRGCSDVTIENLTIASTGGDGIYISSSEKLPYSKNVIIRKVVCDNNPRQGMSVISADGLLVEDCVFSNTGGAAPESGVDLEPNKKTECLKDVVFRRCISENNKGIGFMAFLSHLRDPNGTPISILFEDCQVKGGERHGFKIGQLHSDSPKGEIILRNCHVSNTGQEGLLVQEKNADRVLLRVENCVFNNVATGKEYGKKYPPVSAPIWIYNPDTKTTRSSGGVVFENCLVIDDKDRPSFMAANRIEGEPSVQNVSGTIRVKSPAGTLADFGKNPKNVYLTVKEAAQ